MNHRAALFPFPLFLFLLFVAATAHALPAAELRAGVFKPPRSAPVFSLRGSDGDELNLRRYRGKVVALTFGFTSCPEICPTTLATLAQARGKLGEAAGDFQVVYVTVDPDRDSPDRLRQYLTGFDPTFIGGTGNHAQLAEVRKAYGVLASKQSAAGNPSRYSVHHSSSIYLIDAQGNLRAMMPYGASPDDFAHDVEVLLEQARGDGR